MVIKEEVRDGFLGDLPEDIRIKVMNVHKLVVNTANTVIKKKAYDDIRDLPWFKTMLEEFLVTPMDKKETGSVRVYRKGKRYSCMIQLTGHVTNNRNDLDHELSHEYIRNVHQAMRAEVRRKYDLTLTCESEHGEHFEGFDVWTKQKSAKEIWEKFDAMKTKKAEFHSESAHQCVVTADIDDLPIGLQDLVCETAEWLYEKSHGNLKFDYRQVRSAKDYPDRGIKSGDKLLCIYSLKGAQITYPGHAWNIKGFTGISDKDEDNEELKKTNAEVQKNIRKKGNTDHQSWGQRLIAVKNLETGQQWSAYKHTDTNLRKNLEKSKDFGMEFEVQGFFRTKDTDPTFKIKLGEVETSNNRTFKSTKNFTDINDFFGTGGRKKYDMRRLSNAEPVYKYFRGVEKDNMSDFAVKNARKKIAIANGYKGEIDADLIDDYLQNLSKIIIPSTFIEIPKEVFWNFDELQSIVIPSSVTKIDDYACNTCSSLKNITFPYNLRKIGNWTFTDCTSLTSITIPSSVTTIGSHAFYKCRNLKDVKILGKPKISDSAFDDCRNLSEESKKRILELQPKTMFESADNIGYTELHDNGNGTFSGYITISKDCDIIDSASFRNMCRHFTNNNPTKEIVYDEAEHQYMFELTSEYAQMLYEYLTIDHTIDEAIPMTESEEYNVKMNENEAKRTLRTAANGIITDGKMTQYTANIFANIITKNLLPIWSNGLRKLTIELDMKCKEPIFEFKIPTISQDFVSRFIEGREQINGLLRRSPDVKVRMSIATFKTMQHPDDAFKFFKAAIKYYDSGVVKYSENIRSIYQKLSPEMKQLISNTKLCGLVSLPLQWLFQFDNANMADPASIFTITKKDIQTISDFIKNIYSKYASPEKEKKQILEDLSTTIQAMKEYCSIDDNFKNANMLVEAVSNLYDGKFDNQLTQYREKWMNEQVNLDWTRNPPTPEIRLLQESFGVKKLKKIPRDLVAYITIETESIRDANDKMMIASYCLSKLEIVEWYIELLEVGSKKYIVPHTKPYLESVRTQLLKCYADIMKVKIIPPAERPLFKVDYPKGYEG